MNQTTPDNQAKHWVDKAVTGIEKWQNRKKVDHLHVDDMKTPSGRVHTGALRGVMIHDLVAKALQNAGHDAANTYVFNDMDPMDGLPAYLDKNIYQKYMGMPLYKIPAPDLDESGVDFSQTSTADKKRYQQAKSFAEFYALDFIDAFRKLGCSQEVVWSHELYESGQMDEVIKIALDSVAEMRDIYHEVADYDLPEEWYPFQVFCEQCGKVGTTLVTDWDGQEVSYECKADKVEWATGCGRQGKVSPFGGTGKLLWKADWPAHWSVMGVNVEGSGKDHTTAGGSRDMADAMCQRVFNITVPFDIPYEWILIRGAKMSSSKGVGTSAREFVQLFPTEVGRFLFVNNHYNSVIDFDPRTMSIPDLFDSYDQGARIFWGQEEGDLRLGRSFELSQVEDVPEPHFLPRFRDIALWMQHPELNLIDELKKIKGEELTDLELEIVEQRKKYAQVWLDRYSPPDFQLTPQLDSPDISTLSVDELSFAHQVFDQVRSEPEQNPEELQQDIYQQAKDSIGAKQGFRAIYQVLLGRDAGPRAAWLLLATDPQVLENRVAVIKKLQS